MAPLKMLTCAVALVAVLPARAERVANWQPFITEASLRFGVPSAWIEQVMQAESRGKAQLNGKPIRSPADAIGLMQLMPRTWLAMRRTLGLGANPDDPRDNILAGAFYLRLMYNRFGYPGLFAAYNAGPGRYAAHLTTGHALPSETIAYLETVTGMPSTPPGIAFAPPPECLFAVRHPAPIHSESSAPAQSPASFFVVRHDEQ